MKYQAENWKRLGEWVGRARREATYTKTTEWVAAVGRSDRILLGLERGEEVGDETLGLVAAALNVSVSVLYRILAGEPVPAPKAVSTIEGDVIHVHDFRTWIETTDVLSDFQRREVLRALAALAAGTRTSVRLLPDPDSLPDDEPLKQTYKAAIERGDSVIQEWREKHQGVSKDDLEELAVAKEEELATHPEFPET